MVAMLGQIGTVSTTTDMSATTPTEGLNPSAHTRNYFYGIYLLCL